MSKRWVAAAIAAAMIGIAAEARADGVCIDEKAKQELSCAGAEPRAIDGAKTGTSFHGVTPPAKANASAPPPKPREEPPRDDRTIRLQARQIGLLVASVQRLETLLAATKENAPDRAQILRRLADEYVELESAAFRDKTEAEIRKDAAKTAEADKWMRGARKKAIETYRRLADDYPQHAQID
ncbi:MAG TPA: hypothetical protein VIF62_06595, partial [Labilithrix sp.]